MKNPLSLLVALISIVGTPFAAKAAELSLDTPAPTFKTKTHTGEDFDLNSRKGQWTVLYFYPKAETPGCTKQACAFRDNIKKIRAQGADVYGISADSVEAQKKFHEHHHLNFTLLADEKADIIKLYGTKMPVLNISKRWTFVLDPDLKIRAIEKDVDPVKDADRVANIITALKAKK